MSKKNDKFKGGDEEAEAMLRCFGGGKEKEEKKEKEEDRPTSLKDKYGKK